MTRKNRRKDTDDMMMKTQALAAAVKNDPRWAAVEARDAGADGQARAARSGGEPVKNVSARRKVVPMTNTVDDAT